MGARRADKWEWIVGKVAYENSIGGYIYRKWSFFRVRS